MTKRELIITVPGLPPNPNAASRNWFAARKAEKQFADIVRYSALHARNTQYEYPAWQTLERAEIMVRFVVPTCKPGPVPDTHNLLMGLKKAIDQLTARTRGSGTTQYQGIGIIEDDGDGLSWGAVEVVRQGGESFTIITIRG